MSSSPSVAVIIPTFNASSYLVEAINSFRAQSYSNFSLYIYDGGSDDGTVDIAKSLSQHDDRINVFTFENTTPNQRANIFLKAVQPDICIVAHADDLSFHNRIATQVAIMDQNPDIAILGSASQFWLHDPLHCNEKFYTGIHTYPLTHDEIITRLPFWWCFSTPSVALNANLFKRKDIQLDESLKVGGDWDLYWKAGQVGELRNIAEPLVSVRHHLLSDGAQNKSKIAQETRIVRDRIARETGIATILSEASYQRYLNIDIEYDHASAAMFNDKSELILMELLDTKIDYFTPNQQSLFHNYLERLHQQVLDKVIASNPMVNQWEKLIQERDQKIAELNLQGHLFVKHMEQEIANRDKKIAQLGLQGHGYLLAKMRKLRFLIGIK